MKAQEKLLKVLELVKRGATVGEKEAALARAKKIAERANIDLAAFAKEHGYDLNIAPPVERTGRGKLGGLCGHSVAAVLRTLGKAGMKAKQAKALMVKLGVVVSDHTVQIQIGVGKNGRTSYGPPAPLTDAQVQDLIAQAA